MLMNGIGCLEIHLKGLTIFKPLTQVFLHEENQKTISKAVARKQKCQIIYQIYILFASFFVSIS